MKGGAGNVLEGVWMRTRGRQARRSVNGAKDRLGGFAGGYRVDLAASSAAGQRGCFDRTLLTAAQPGGRHTTPPPLAGPLSGSPDGAT